MAFSREEGHFPDFPLTKTILWFFPDFPHPQQPNPSQKITTHFHKIGWKYAFVMRNQNSLIMEMYIRPPANSRDLNFSTANDLTRISLQGWIDCFSCRMPLYSRSRLDLCGGGQVHEFTLYRGDLTAKRAVAERTSKHTRSSKLCSERRNVNLITFCRVDLFSEE